MSGEVRAGQERMFRWIAGLPGQLRASAKSPGLAAVKPLDRPPRQILICGMGGSAMAGSLLADGWPGLEIPLLVHRDPLLPTWVGPDTLLMACSYSGNTAETLGALEQGRRRHCALAAVTSGGSLLELAEREGIPVAVMPEGQPPRTALGASLGAQLHLLSRLGLIPCPDAAIGAACDQVEAGSLVRLDGDVEPVGDAAARALAGELVGRFPVLFTAGNEAHGPGRRLLNQFQENAKRPAHLAAFPELNHNEIVAWNLDPDQAAVFALITLRGDDEDPTMRKGVDVALELLEPQFAWQHTLTTVGDERLARILGLIVFGDLLSAHLAVARGVDPVPISQIDALKARLAGQDR